MARINDADVVAVRERARVDDVIGEVVALRSAGGGSLKGLCPFHDERSPSFHVTPSKGLWHCFGCQAGGDVIDFVERIEQVAFAEAVEKLAARVGIELRYERGGAAPGLQQSERTRLVEANRAAAEFFRDRLRTPEAQVGRQLMQDRGFEEADLDHFGVGFAPAAWDELLRHLRNRGFSDQELLKGGLVVAGRRGPYDRFRGRLVWPIRDASGEVVGFGARRVLADDEGPKYLNTPETPIYRKSQVLYGVDLARKAIARKRQAVVVEGYTDVMAAHLSGVDTAVATCGTAFGADHIKIIRRLLMDQDELRGEVIFTFDGDAAGRKAALKAFEADQRFVAQTFVAIEPNGLDPCEVRQQHGPEAVRELVARRVPLFEFAIRSTLDQHDLNRPEGRVAALRAVAPMLATIRDRALRPEYQRLVSGWLGLEPAAITEAIRLSRRGEAKAGGPAAAAGTAGRPVAERGEEPDDAATRIEREALKCALQVPQHAAPAYEAIEASAFRVKEHLLVHEAITTAGGPAGVDDPRAWIERVLAVAADDDVRACVRRLAVEPLPANGESDDELSAYAASVVARLLEIDATRRTVELKARLQRMNPLSDAGYDLMFADLLALEKYRRDLREQAMGRA